MLYEITNPSDDYTMKADRFDVAAVACLFLGEGKYGLEPLDDGGTRMPIFLLGGADEWCKKTFGHEVGALVDSVMANERGALVETLRSVLIGKRSERLLFEKTLARLESDEKRKAFAEEWLDTKRSSMNNIGRRAQTLAEHFAKPAAASVEKEG